MVVDAAIGDSARHIVARFRVEYDGVTLEPTRHAGAIPWHHFNPMCVNIDPQGAIDPIEFIKPFQFFFKIKLNFLISLLLSLVHQLSHDGEMDSLEL